MAVVIMHEERCEFNSSLSFIKIFRDCSVYLVVKFLKPLAKSSREEIVVIKQVLKENKQVKVFCSWYEACEWRKHICGWLQDRPENWNSNTHPFLSLSTLYSLERHWQVSDILLTNYILLPYISALKIACTNSKG